MTTTQTVGTRLRAIAARVCSADTRWALSCGTLVLGLLALAVRDRGRIMRIGVVLVGGIGSISYYYFVTSPSVVSMELSAMAVAWLPNVLMVSAVGALLFVRSRRAA